jgi:hypothetical protein
LLERPENAHGLKAAIITAYVFHPAPDGQPCRKKRVVRTARIRTKRPASDLVFFDGRARHRAESSRFTGRPGAARSTTTLTPHHFQGIEPPP